MKPHQKIPVRARTDYDKGFKQAAELIALAAECRGHEKFAADIRKCAALLLPSMRPKPKVRADGKGRG